MVLKSRPGCYRKMQFLTNVAARLDWLKVPIVRAIEHGWSGLEAGKGSVMGARKVGMDWLDWLGGR